MNRHNTPTRVLVVDDHPLSAQIVARQAVRQKFHAALAASGYEAMEWLTEEPGAFDVVVSDVEMPQMSGFELMQHIRQRFPRLPIILMTAFFDEEKHAAALAWGASALLKKPFGSQELAGAIRHALNGGSRATGGEPRVPATARTVPEEACAA